MKMEEWKECRLGDYCDFQNGYAFKSSEFKTNGEYKIVKIKELKDGLVKFFDDSASVDIQGIKEFEKYKIYRNDVLFALTGDPVSKPNPLSWVGRVSIYRSDENALLNQRTCKIKKSERIDNKFLYYYFRQWENFYALASKATGSASQANISTNTIADTIIKLPPLPTQQKIAAILSSLDDKIELNNKINTNLAQQAQAFFKNWFVDFAPFGGKMPEGWKLGKLSEYCNFQEGYVNPAQTHNEYFDGDVKWLRAVDINESFILNTSRTLTKCGFESAGKSAFLFKPGSIAISKSGTVGRLGIISDFMCGNRAVIGIELKEQQNLSFIHQYQKSRQTEFPDMAVGSVQKNQYVSILENLDIIIPLSDFLEKYAKICMPFYDQIKTNCIENNNLISIRNTLLPKLMNGEIGV